MIVTEYLIINGKDFVRTYSDAGMQVERDGVLYDEAYDPIDSGRIYTESEQTEGDPNEARIDDYKLALSKLGVEVIQ